MKSLFYSFRPIRHPQLFLVCFLIALIFVTIKQSHAAFHVSRDDLTLTSIPIDNVFHVSQEERNELFLVLF